MNDSLPNFLIVGAAKSGTTSLFDQLCRHPDVFQPYIKEPGYFIPQNQYSSIKNWEDYKNIFKDSENYKAKGEASVTYLFDPDSPELIKEKLGDQVKILIILRNPIDMSHSLWLHRKRDMKEDMDFFDALEKRDLMNSESKEEGINYDWDYLNRAKFFNQVKRYKDNFSRVKILIFEDYIKNVKTQFQETCNFLGVDSQFEIELETKNKAFKPKFPAIQKFLTYELSFKEALKKILPHSLLVKLKASVENINKTEVEKEKLSLEERSQLIPLFDEDVKKLSLLLEKDLTVYWQDFAKNKLVR